MTWNYRIIHSTKKYTDGQIEDFYEVHEVYYNETGIYAWSKESVSPGGGDVDDLWDDIGEFIHAFHRPILQEKDGKLIEEGQVKPDQAQAAIMNTQDVTAKQTPDSSHSSSLRLDSLREQVSKLKSLLDDPQPGLMSWSLAYGECMTAITGTWKYSNGD